MPSRFGLRGAAPVFAGLVIASTSGATGFLPVEDQILAACGAAPVVIVGERHREAESHALFLELVERLAARGERLAVGLEIPADRQKQLDLALGGWRSPAGIAHPIVDSDSYRDLIRALGTVAGAATVKVFAIDAPRGGPRDRDAEMAARVGALTGGGCDRVLVLAGNLHALKRIPWAAELVPPPAKLARLLEDAGVRVASLVQSFTPDCARGRHPSFYPAGEAAADEAVRGLWERLNTDPRAEPRLASRAADGVIAWGCGE